MNAEIQTIIRNLREVLQGEPWHGKSVMDLLNEVDPPMAYIRPKETQHSPIDLLYHMITWSQFTANRMEKDPPPAEETEALDWREIDPVKHTWKGGMEQLKAANEKIIAMLQEKDDSLLLQKVAERNYNFGQLLHGQVQHLIYHSGQVAYVRKLLQGS